MLHRNLFKVLVSGHLVPLKNHVPCEEGTRTLPIPAPPPSRPNQENYVPSFDMSDPRSVFALKSQTGSHCSELIQGAGKFRLLKNNCFQMQKVGGGLWEDVTPWKWLLPP